MIVVTYQEVNISGFATWTGMMLFVIDVITGWMNIVMYQDKIRIAFISKFSHLNSQRH